MLVQNEVLSSVLGWMSISCWIVVYAPQFYENYQLQSGEGLSVLFVLTWLVGDLCNLVGAIFAGLLLTVKIIGGYYSLCDCLLLLQIYYYRWKRNRKFTAPAPPIIDDVPRPPEETPLLNGDRPSSEHHQSSALRGVIRYVACILFVFATGVVAWAIDGHINEDIPRSPPQEVIEWKGQLLGWVSAILFIGARIPQIRKNMQTKCEGLSPALFLFSILGNTTYALSILVVSLSLHHLVANASWLAGSILTIFLDMFVLYQCFYYRKHRRT